VQRGSGAPLVDFRKAADRVIGVQALDRDTTPLKRRDHPGIRMQPTIRANPQDQALGQLVEHPIEILYRQRMPIPPPPVANDPVRQHDQIPGLLRTVDYHPAEAVILKPRHGQEVPTKPSAIGSSSAQGRSTTKDCEMHPARGKQVRLNCCHER
jgi:hypothetical protein